MPTPFPLDDLRFSVVQPPKYRWWLAGKNTFIGLSFLLGLATIYGCYEVSPWPGSWVDGSPVSLVFMGGMFLVFSPVLRAGYQLFHPMGSRFKLLGNLTMNREGLTIDMGDGEGERFYRWEEIRMINVYFSEGVKASFGRQNRDAFETIASVRLKIRLSTGLCECCVLNFLPENDKKIGLLYQALMEVNSWGREFHRKIQFRYERLCEKKIHTARVRACAGAG